MTVDLAALPPTPVDADPVIVPGLLTGLGITPPNVPAWITDQQLIADILAGYIDIPTDFMGDQ